MSDKIYDLHGVRLKPGMVLITEDNEYWIVFLGFGGELAIIQYGKPNWNSVPCNKVFNKVKIIKKSVGYCSIDDGETLWEKPKTLELTMDEIAVKFKVPVEYIKIKK